MEISEFPTTEFPTPTPTHSPTPAFYFTKRLPFIGSIVGLIVVFALIIISMKQHADLAYRARQHLRQVATEAQEALETAFARKIPALLYSVFTRERPAPESREGEEALCAVCLCDFCGKDQVKPLKCGHVYHAACLDQWLRRSKLCPLCKQDAEPAIIIPSPSAATTTSVSACRTATLPPQSITPRPHDLATSHDVESPPFAATNPGRGDAADARGAATRLGARVSQGQGDDEGGGVATTDGAIRFGSPVFVRGFSVGFVRGQGTSLDSVIDSVSSGADPESP